MIDNVKVYGLEESIRASKYPKAVDVEACDSTITDTVRNLAACPTGTGHDQFLTGIVVQFDLTFSIKAWVEAERYHFLDFVSSQSTMHRILSFDVEKQCNEYVVTGGILQSLIDLYHDNPTPENYLRVLYNVPVGFRLTARMTTNYRQLKTIYQQRRSHRLPEWREFCKWVETLPEAELITGKSEKRMTNFDRIKGMSVSELAEFLRSMVDDGETHEVACYGCIDYGTHHSDPRNKGTNLYSCDGCGCEGVGLDIEAWLNLDCTLKED